MFTENAALNPTGYSNDLIEKPAFQSKALSPNSGYNAHSPTWIPEEIFPNENKLFLLKNPKLDEAAISPIIPILTTYDAGKVRHQSNNNQLKLNAESRFNRLNIYGIEPEMNAKKSKAYKAPLETETTETEKPFFKKKERPRFDLSELTVNEVEQLESIHRKLFNTTTTKKDSGISILPESKLLKPLKEKSSLLIYQKPSEGKVSSSVNALMQEHFGSAISLKNLDPEILNELAAIKDFPDLDELTRGMDLSLLNRPGGFALLKQQFMERLIQRTLGRRKRLRDSTLLTQKSLRKPGGAFNRFLP